jgi:hypothetical protein
MGGMGHIYYSSISMYARDNGIELEPFVTFIRAIDSVFLEYQAEKAKQQADKTGG